MQFSSLGSSKMEISETDFSDIVTIQNDQISYVKHVLAHRCVLFTLFGWGGGGLPRGLGTTCLCSFPASVVPLHSSGCLAEGNRIIPPSAADLVAFMSPLLLTLTRLGALVMTSANVSCAELPPPPRGASTASSCAWHRKGGHLPTMHQTHLYIMQAITFGMRIRRRGKVWEVHNSHLSIVQPVTPSMRIQQGR